MASIQRKEWIRKYKRNNSETIAWAVFDIIIIGAALLILGGALI